MWSVEVGKFDVHPSPTLPALQPDPQRVGHDLELAETAQQAHFEVDLVDMAGDPCTTEQQVTAELGSLVESSHIWSIHYLTWQKCTVVGQGLELVEFRKKKNAASRVDQFSFGMCVSN